MAVRNKKITNVSGIQSKFTDCRERFRGITLVQRIDHDQPFTRDQQVGAYEIGADVIEVIEKFDGTRKLLRLGIGSRRALAVSGCAELATVLLRRGRQCKTQQHCYEQQTGKQRTHSEPDVCKPHNCGLSRYSQPEIPVALDTLRQTLRS